VYDLNERVERLKEQLDYYNTADATEKIIDVLTQCQTALTLPVDMLLFCPNCLMQHIDIPMLS